MEKGREESKRGNGVYQSSWAATKYHRLRGLTIEMYFLTVLEAEVQSQGASKFGLQMALLAHDSFLSVFSFSLCV